MKVAREHGNATLPDPGWVLSPFQEQAGFREPSGVGLYPDMRMWKPHHWVVISNFCSYCQCGLPKTATNGKRAASHPGNPHPAGIQSTVCSYAMPPLFSGLVK